MEDRLKGQPLAKVGDKYGITKARIQYIQKELLPDSRLEEEKFRRFFETYLLDSDMFHLITGLSVQSYQYLLITSKKQLDKKNIFELWFDVSFDPEFKKRVFSSFKENNKKNLVSGNARDSIIKIILRNKYMDQRPLAEFISDYYCFLQEYHCQEIKPMAQKAFVNKIELSPVILLSKGRMIRYYDIAAHDFSLLLKTLNFQQYQGFEYSTLKFYREYTDIIAQYGIYDEYELHNLLRKLSRTEEYVTFFQGVYFGRMPVVKFGPNTNRKKQAINLIKDKNLNFLEATTLYEQEYGIRSTSLMSEKNIRQCIIKLSRKTPAFRYGDIRHKPN